MQCNFSNTRYFGKKCIVVILTREKVGKGFNLISVSLSFFNGAEMFMED